MQKQFAKNNFAKVSPIIPNIFRGTNIGLISYQPHAYCVISKLWTKEIITILRYYCVSTTHLTFNPLYISKILDKSAKIYKKCRLLSPCWVVSWCCGCECVGTCLSRRRPPRAGWGGTAGCGYPPIRPWTCSTACLQILFNPY